MVGMTERGFTLVELMVVLAILALASTAVILTVRPGGGDAETQAARFAARVAALRDRSVIEGRTLGLWVTASGYGFEQRRDGQWQPLGEARLSPRDWDAGTAVLVGGASQARLTFNRIGLPDRPLQVELTAGEDSATIRVDAAGDVAVE
ncbi:MAG: GspH/FimT family pseudopilin [Sphingopyxis sp.]